MLADKKPEPEALQPPPPAFSFSSAAPRDEKLIRRRQRFMLGLAFVIIGITFWLTS